MDTKNGSELIDYLNANGGGRFVARPSDTGEGHNWVLVADLHAADPEGYPRRMEPIADFAAHLDRARRETALFPREYVALLESWDGGEG